MKVPKMLSRKVADDQRHVPPLEHAALLLDHHRVQERRHGQPGEEAGVLDRVPGPVAAPAELHVGPPHAERDADGEEEPGHEGPLADGVDPAAVEPAPKQRRDREGERDGDADVAEVEHRRVDDHAEVLQLRVEAAAVGRREGQPLERVGGEEHHRDEEDHHRGGDAGDIRQQVGVAARGDPLGQRRKAGQHHRPEEQRALLPRPERRDDVVGGQVARGVGRDVLDVEVVGDDALPQGERRHEQGGSRA